MLREVCPAPALALDHLCAMTDDTGLFQHAVHSVPDRAHGYCVDEIIQLQLRRLPPVEDRLDDVRREQRQPQNPADVGRRHVAAFRPSWASEMTSLAPRGGWLGRRQDREVLPPIA